MKSKIKNISFTVVFFIINVFPLIFPAILNGFPLIYSDSGTYIGSGFNGDVPIDRPITYGLFVKATYMSTSLWCVLIAQACIVIFFIHQLIKQFISKNHLLITSLFIWFLSFTTGLSNYTSQIMPDIFSAITIIGVALLIANKKMKLPEYLVFILVIFTSITHLSNLVLILGMTLVVFILVLFRIVEKKALYRLLLLTFFSFTSLLLINKYYTNKYQLARASNVFIFARLLETGVVKEYLNDNCYKYDYILCDQIERLPKLGTNFIWDGDNSPLYDPYCKQNSWTYCWEEKNKELGVLIKDILINPHYLKKIAPVLFVDFYRQLLDFEIGPLTPQKEHSSVQDVLQDKLKEEIPSYKNAVQYQETLTFSLLNKIQFWVVTISTVLFCGFILFYKKLHITKDSAIIITILILGILGNALTVEIFSTVLNRYQSRIIWILPLLVLTLTYTTIFNKVERKE